MSKLPSEVVYELLANIDYSTESFMDLIGKVTTMGQRFEEDERNAARRSQGIPGNVTPIRRPGK